MANASRVFQAAGRASIVIPIHIYANKISGQEPNCWPLESANLRIGAVALLSRLPLPSLLFLMSSRIRFSGEGSAVDVLRVPHVRPDFRANVGVFVLRFSFSAFLFSLFSFHEE